VWEDQLWFFIGGESEDQLLVLCNTGHHNLLCAPPSYFLAHSFACGNSLKSLIITWHLYLTLSNYCINCAPTTNPIPQFCSHIFPTWAEFHWYPTWQYPKYIIARRLCLIIYSYFNKLCCIFLVLWRIHEHFENIQTINILVKMESIYAGVE
jgi:hypothetical protein